MPTFPAAQASRTHPSAQTGRVAPAAQASRTFPSDSTESPPSYVGTKAGQTDGVDEYLTGGTPTLPNSGFSVSFWFKRNASSGTQTLVSRRTTGTNAWQVYTSAGPYIIASWNASGGNASTSSVAFTSGAWTHVGVRYDLNGSLPRVTLFVNGAQVATATAAAGTAVAVTATVNIGRQATNNQFLNGNICDVALWDVSLSDAQFLAMYNGGTRTDPESASGETAVSLWAFQATDDMTGTTGSIDNLSGGTDATPINTESGDLVAGPP